MAAPFAERAGVEPRVVPAREDEPIPVGANRSFYAATKKANEIRAYKAILDFVDRYLKAGPQNSQDSTNN